MVAKFARAITEAIHYIKADKETTKAIIGSTPNSPTRRTRTNLSKITTSSTLDVPYADPAA